MKKTFLLFSTLLTGLFAETTDHGRADSTKNIGHIIFTSGPALPLYGGINISAYTSLSYKTKLDTGKKRFHSYSIEFGSSNLITESTSDEWVTTDSTKTVYMPKIMGIHYLNKFDQNRVFVGIGGHLSGTLKSIYKEKPLKIWYYTETDNNGTKYFYTKEELKGYNERKGSTAIGSSLAVGVDFGDPTGAICILQLTYDQPLIQVGGDETKISLGDVTLTFGIGF
jgi:hypothetical protein